MRARRPIGFREARGGSAPAGRARDVSSRPPRGRSASPGKGAGGLRSGEETGARHRGEGKGEAVVAGASLVGASAVASDRDLATEAVARFLDALGLPPGVRSSDDLACTPARVAEAWLEDLVDGYRHDPAGILDGAIPSRNRDLVAVTGIEFHSICPHHLLPSRGVAHVAYLPAGRVVGFGQIVRLVDALAHRLVLQEDLAHAVAEALVQHLGARGAACALEAEQLCLTVRGARRPRARTHAEAYAGTLARDRAARRRFLDVIRGVEGRESRVEGGAAARPALRPAGRKARRGAGR